MKKSNLMLVTAFALATSLSGSLIGSAKCNVSIGFEAEGQIVIPAKKKLVNVFASASEDSSVIAHLEEGEYLHVVGKPSKDWFHVENEDGSVDGYIKVSKVKTNKDIKKAVKENLDDFNLTATLAETVAGYSGKNDAEKYQNFNYTSKVKLNDNAVVYKTDSTSRSIKGKYNEQEYVRITGDGVRVRTEADTSDNSKILTLAEKGYEYKLLGVEDGFCKVETDWGEAYIVDSYCKKFTKRTPKSNISKVDLDNKKYKITDEGTLLEIKTEEGTFYVDDNAVERTDKVALDSSARAVISRNTAYDVLGYDYGDEDIKLVGYNNLGMPESVWAKTEDMRLDVWFKDVDAIPIAEDEDNDEDEDKQQQDNSRDTSSTVFRPDKSDSSRYSYDYKNNSTQLRNQVVNYALKFLGNPYVYGGESLTNGIDCSAFCMKVLHNFGLQCGRSTAIQVSEKAGRAIKASEIQPGDLIYYTRDGSTPYHVVMYLGGNKCVNASCRKLGVCISNINTDRILMIKNYID